MNIIDEKNEDMQTIEATNNDNISHDYQFF